MLTKNIMVYDEAQRRHQRIRAHAEKARFARLVMVYGPSARVRDVLQIEVHVSGGAT